MPIQNGLELFRWVKSHYPNVECIFLTSHSDFEYVQEALKLGGFDYILQPARYEEIEETIRRAIEKSTQEMCHMGIESLVIYFVKHV